MTSTVETINELVNQFCHDYPEDIRERVRTDMLTLAHEIHKLHIKGLDVMLYNKARENHDE